MQTYKVIMKLLKDCLSNGPHLGSPQQVQKVTGIHIFKEISNYFATGLLEDPVSIRFERGCSRSVVDGGQVIGISVSISIYLMSYQVGSRSVVGQQQVSSRSVVGQQLIRSWQVGHQYTPSCLKVMWWWWWWMAHEIILSASQVKLLLLL